MNTEFFWTDELVKEYAYMILCTQDKSYLGKPFMGILDFKASKTKPKEYEILSYRNFKSGNNEIHTKKSVSCNPIYFNGFDDNTGEFSRQDCFEIHSVKRLSDNEVFSIGDEVLYKEQYSKPILGFDIYSHPQKGKVCRIITSCYNGTNNEKQYNDILEIQKAKPTLFTTEDRVAIKEGDTVYPVSNGFETNTVKVDEFWYKNTKQHFKAYFSTEEKALEYINLNKPVLSVNDFIQVYPAPIGSPLYNEFLSNLIELAKSKIKTHE